MAPVAPVIMAVVKTVRNPLWDNGFAAVLAEEVMALPGTRVCPVLFHRVGARSPDALETDDPTVR